MPISSEGGVAGLEFGPVQLKLRQVTREVYLRRVGAKFGEAQSLFLETRSDQIELHLVAEPSVCHFRFQTRLKRRVGECRPFGAIGVRKVALSHLRFHAQRKRGRKDVLFCGPCLRRIGCGGLRLTAWLSRRRVVGRRRLYPKRQLRKFTPLV